MLSSAAESARKIASNISVQEDLPLVKAAAEHCLAEIQIAFDAAYSNVPAPLRGLGITFIITGLMGIGFQSFGGMLTGGDEAPAEAEPEVVLKEEEKKKENKKEVDEKSISYNEAINE